MLTTMDAAGRVMIPELAVHVEQRPYGPVLVPDGDPAPLTDEAVRSILERTRR